ncbi:sterile alpha motif domain-containing protein 9-like isoform X2 [Mya arenaria]|uniref:sterile alpha motif domain-containing protein 9-like isoform X2 n=1 Tax=Mya arenaria TaxID=6604 RepID=UPI0022E23630|nr:sterile alpha motif domain-containing protein 9-like isoform X2 [Mya arenaria]
MLSDRDGSLQYSKAHQLNVDITSDVLRELLKKKSPSLKNLLSTQASTIKKHFKKKILKQKQHNLLTEKHPTVESFDVTLLTYILRNLVSLSVQEEADIDKLRVIRNDLSHIPKYQLHNNDIFDEAKGAIRSLCRGFDEDTIETVESSIKRLEENELISKVTYDRILLLRKEAFMDKLLKASDSENAEETKLRYNLSVYAEIIGRYIEVDVLSATLLTKELIPEELHTKVISALNTEDQASLLVLHMLGEDHERVLMFCTCIRDMNSNLSDVICREQTNLGKLLWDVEKKAIRNILKHSLEKCITDRVRCEDLHEYVETKRRCRTMFERVQTCVLEEFSDVIFEDSHSSFQGLKWKDNIDNYDNSEKLGSDVLPVINLPSEDFALYVGQKLKQLSDSPKMAKMIEIITKSITEELISSLIFSKLKPDSVREFFKGALSGDGYGLTIGVEETLIEIHQTLQVQSNVSVSEKTTALRSFKTVASNGYSASSIVSSVSTDLTDPAHYFLYPSQLRDLRPLYFLSMAIKFICACINGRQNGTFHFGIKPLDNEKGKVIGLSTVLFDNINLLSTFNNCIKRCFGVNANRITRCLGPLQNVDVDGNKTVIEFDVEPVSTFLEEKLVQIQFPPWGNTKQKCFLRTPLGSIEAIDQTIIEKGDESISNIFDRRRMLDEEKIHLKKTETNRLSQLTQVLTAGNKYVTPHLFPHVICGQYSNANNSEELLSDLTSMESVFLSACVVFNFDDSTSLRPLIEKGKLIFDVLDVDKSQMIDPDITKRAWINCGHSCDETVVVRKRFDPRGFSTVVERAVMSFAERTLFIFFIFQDLHKSNPLFMTALEFCNKYTDKTIIISDRKENVESLLKEVPQYTDVDVDGIFFYGFSWKRLALALKAVFVNNPDIMYKLPNGDGTVTLLTEKDKTIAQIDDIDIISGHECVAEFEEMNDDDRRKKKAEVEKSFYEGNEVCWWNFFFDGQVCRRDYVADYTERIEQHIRNGAIKRLFEIVEIFHQRGAGGTTVGKQLLWKFSQFKADATKALKACIVQNVTKDKTVKQIARLRQLGEDDKDLIKPVLVLVDNTTEEEIQVLKGELDLVSYKQGSKSGQLFCILIVVSQVDMQYSKSRLVLKHFLSKEEKSRFEDRSKDVKDLQSLIAFNVMKENFDKQYIKRTVHDIVSGLETKEEKVLQHLSLISMFDGKAAIPTSVFDDLMGCVVSTSGSFSVDELLNSKHPAGLAFNLRHKGAVSYRQTWNTKTTESLELMLKYKETKGLSAVTIISPLIVEDILEYLKGKYSLTLEDVVEDLLNFMERKTTEASEKERAVSIFKDVICDLFVIRQNIKTDEKAEGRREFSNLVRALTNQLPGDMPTDPYTRADKWMKKCFVVSRYPFIEQHRARLGIFYRQYPSALDAIQQAIAVNDKVPIFYDTYGQIYRSQMDLILRKTPDYKFAGTSKDIFQLAQQAIRYFRRAQELDQINDMTSYLMELNTALSFLDKVMDVDEEVGDRTLFVRFLNGVDTEKFDYLGKEIYTFRKWSEQYFHITNTLVRIEYELFMKKRPCKDEASRKYTEGKANTLRYQYESIYGKEDECFVVGETFRSLKKAYLNDLAGLERKVERLEHKHDLNEKDLMVYLAYHIIKISLMKEIEDEQKSELEQRYPLLIQRSEKLLQIQRDKKKRKLKVRTIYIEAYMYFTLLHWPLQLRSDKYSSDICRTDRLPKLLEEWQNEYDERFASKRNDQVRVKPTTFFALAEGNPGCDIVDQDMIRDVWREQQNKDGYQRREVKEDDIWNQNLGVRPYVRLEGVVDGNGHSIKYKIVSDEGKLMKPIFQFNIQTYESCKHLRNRRVSFVLGFTWRGPAAFEVILKENVEDPSVLKENSNEIFAKGSGAMRAETQTPNIWKKKPGTMRSGDWAYNFAAADRGACSVEGLDSMGDSRSVKTSYLLSSVEKTFDLDNYIKSEYKSDELGSATQIEIDDIDEDTFKKHSEPPLNQDTNQEPQSDDKKKKKKRKKNKKP